MMLSGLTSCTAQVSLPFSPPHRFVSPVVSLTIELLFPSRSPADEGDRTNRGGAGPPLLCASSPPCPPPPRADLHSVLPSSRCGPPDPPRDATEKAAVEGKSGRESESRVAAAVASTSDGANTSCGTPASTASSCVHQSEITTATRPVPSPSPESERARERSHSPRGPRSAVACAWKSAPPEVEPEASWSAAEGKVSGRTEER